jgi:hypothetical protein
MKFRLLAAVISISAVLVPAARASQLIDRDATAVRLAVNDKGMAMLTYRARGRLRHVLAWGAANARPPAAGRNQVAFRLDYAGGWGAYRRVVWKNFRNSCTPMRPGIRWLVTACRARDGSLWAVQSWRRGLPNYGLAPTNWIQAAWELRLSHWTGPLPQLTVRFGWAYRRYQQLYGRLTYRGLPVHGYQSTGTGQPLDSFGRNVYVDTLDSAYGSGWRRENSFLTHGVTGGFCYGFYPHGSRPSGRGRRYRATVIGPGVTPDVYWEGTPPAVYDRGFDQLANEDLRTLLAGDPHCRPV